MTYLRESFFIIFIIYIKIHAYGVFSVTIRTIFETLPIIWKKS